MKKHIGRWIALAMVLLALGGAYWIYASLHGSLLHKLVVTQRVKDYVEETYPGSGFEVEFARFEFKYDGYYCPVQSPSSVDTRFRVIENRDASLTDSYEWDVLEKDATVTRIEDELRQAAKNQLLPAYGHRCRLFGCGYYEQEEVDRSRFSLDMTLDPAAPPHPLHLLIWTETEQEQPTLTELAQRLREAKAMTDRLGYQISYFSVSLEYPYELMDGELTPTCYSTPFDSSEVPAEVIAGDGLEDYLLTQLGDACLRGQ